MSHHAGGHGAALRQWLRFLSPECFHVFVYQESVQKGRVELYDSHRGHDGDQQHSGRQQKRASQHFAAEHGGAARRGRIRSESFNRPATQKKRSVSTEVLDMAFGTMPLHGEGSVKLHIIKGKQLLVTKLFRYCPDEKPKAADTKKTGAGAGPGGGAGDLAPKDGGSSGGPGSRTSGQFVQKRYYQAAAKQVQIKTKIAVCMLVDILPDETLSVERYVCQHFWAVEYHMSVFVRNLLDILKILRLSDRISLVRTASPSQDGGSGSGSGSFRARSISLPTGRSKAASARSYRRLAWRRLCGSLQREIVQRRL